MIHWRYGAADGGWGGRLREISAKYDNLERLSALVEFQAFRPELERAVRAPIEIDAVLVYLDRSTTDNP